MKKDAADRLFYLGAGPIAAIFLGAGLVLIRDWTTASNFSFVFLALIMTVAEFGGRAAAVATAVVSTLSIDFFLTQPYLRLSIAEKGDIIACLGLAGCGLLAAALSERRPGLDALLEVRVLDAVMDSLAGTGTLPQRLGEAARRCCDILPLAAVVIRDDQGHVVASSAPPDALRPVPTIVVRERYTKPATGADPAEPLPPEGARMPLGGSGARAGWLDFWGDGTPAEAAQRQALSDVAAMIGLALGAARGAQG